MKSFIQFIIESAAVPERVQLQHKLETSGMIPDQQKQALADWDARPENWFKKNIDWEKIEQENKSRQDKGETTLSRVWNPDTHDWDSKWINPNITYIEAIPDERSDDEYERQQAAELKQKSLYQRYRDETRRLAQQDPVAAGIGMGFVGDPKNGFPTVGAADVAAAVLGARAGPTVTPAVTSALKTLKQISGIGRPLLPQVGSGIKLTGKILASQGLYAGAEHVLDTAKIENPYVRKAVSTAAAFAPWSPSLTLAPLEAFKGGLFGTGLEGLRQNAHNNAYTDVEKALKNNPDLSQEEQQKIYDNSFDYYNSPAEAASYGMMFGPKGAMFGAAAGMPIHTIKRGIQHYFK